MNRNRAFFLRRDGMDRPHAGGRWHRILRALQTRPMMVDQLLAETDPGKHPPGLERRKVKVALRDMGSLGLVQQTAGWGWASTAEGQRTRDQLDTEADTAPVTLVGRDLNITVETGAAS